MDTELLNKLADKSITKNDLFLKVEKNYKLLPTIFKGVYSTKAAIRYGCAKVLNDLSETHPEKLYPHIDFFFQLLDSKYRILIWNALAVIANLTKVDIDGKFENIFKKYYSFLNDDYMVTVANVIGNSGKIALAKPHLIEKITSELLKVKSLSTTPHLTDECKRVIIEKTIRIFDLIFDKNKDNKNVISFVESNLNSSRKTLKEEAEKFIKKFNV